MPPQSYAISATPDHFTVIGRDEQALFYARQTLAQLHRAYGQTLPCLEIADSPDFPVRGVLLDISRDKVPTMPTLFQIVDWLAELKINQLQLYTEHTFAYAGHEEVWRDASPMTGEEIRRLDAYCKERFIELVPNQNSLGHMERWLKHPRYLPLAECPDGAESPWGFRWKGPFSLSPTDPASLELIADLYSQLLPNFSSKLFNVGCDETFDIGQGRSRGVETAYTDFLNKIFKLAASHGRRIQFWADGILEHPNQIPAVPKDSIALAWGYEADHPFDQNAARLAEAGLSFYVCPGTSSWCSIAGRTDNMLANQRAAAEAGLRHGAIGYLNTDWGDFGHLQYWPISFAGLAAGAAFSWCLDSNRDIDLPAALDLQVFRDSAQVMGKLAIDLGNVYQLVGKLIPNRSVLFNRLVPSAARKDPMEGISPANLAKTAAAIRQIIRPLSHARMDRPDADLIRAEFANAAAMLDFACRKQERDLSDVLKRVIDTHRNLWLARNRPGGLDDSLCRLSDSFPRD
jgi:hexosaminidase